MSTKQIFIPLALIGAIFVAVAVSLYIYAVPRPLWTTTSPKVQKGIEFLGVYKGMPRQFAKYGYMGGNTDFTGDLWAYFRTSKKFTGQTFRCRIAGKKVSTHSVYVDLPFGLASDTSERVFRVGVPQEYPPDIQNGMLELVQNDRLYACWKLDKMPAPIRAIDPSEPFKLEGEALGYRLRLKPPFEQTATIDRKTKLPVDSSWHAEADIMVPSRKTGDQYEMSTWLSRTAWGRFKKESYTTMQLPSSSTTTTVQEWVSSYVPTDRLELALDLRRYRTLKETVVLKDVVCERCDDKHMSKVPGDLGYQLKSCTNMSFTTPGGLRMRIVSSPIGMSYCSDTIGIYLMLSDKLDDKVIPTSPLSRSTNKPISLQCAGGYGSNGTEVNLSLPLPFKSGPKIVRLPEYKLVFYQKAVLEEKTIRLMAPVKLMTRIP